MKAIKIAFLALVSFTSSVLPGEACTDFLVKTTTGGVIAARSMEWGSDLKSRLAIHGRGESCTSKTPESRDGLKWTSRFGYVGADVAGLDAIVDGVNEKGLSFGELWFPQYTKFATRTAAQDSSTIDVTDLGSWILGNFSSVEEVKEALGKVVVGARNQPSFGGIPTPHLAVHDAQGKSLVVEWIDGKAKMYDNQNGVLTNSPPFDWQTINLSNYLQIKPSNPQPLQLSGTVLSCPGQGGGFLGIPGDWTPPSRFVRTTAMLQFAKPVEDTAGGVNLALHVLNAVDIPKGDIRDKIEGQECNDYTQWVLVKDLSNLALYYRSYDNLNVRKVDLKKLDLNAVRPVRRVQIAGGSDSTEYGP